MANNKTGFNYYNVDTDRYQDIRIKRLKKDFGCAGIAVYDYILCDVYRDKGCFSEWDDNRAFDVAEYFGLKESLVDEIVKYCGVVGLFEKGLLSRGIVTSQSIQKRYIDMCNRSKRTSCEIPETVKLQEESNILHEESNIIHEESTQNSCSLPQRKVKESKVDEKKEVEEKHEVFFQPAFKSDVEPQTAPEPKPAKVRRLQLDALQFHFTSVHFMQAWSDLLSLAKWKKKPLSALQLALNQLSRYDEKFAIGLIEKAHAGNYQGVVFDDTDEKYQRWLKMKQSNTGKTQISSPVKNYEGWD